MKTVCLMNTSTGIAVGESIGCAEDSFTRLVGLLGRQGLDAGGGLWIRPSSGIHTFFMRFSIDAVGLDRELRVVRVWAAVRPWRVPGLDFKVDSVVELAAGEARARKIGVGDQCKVVV